MKFQYFVVQLLIRETIKCEFELHCVEKYNDVVLLLAVKFKESYSSHMLKDRAKWSLIEIAGNDALEHPLHEEYSLQNTSWAGVLGWSYFNSCL